jgi:hypothetical protein
MDKYTELEKQAQKFLDETDTMQFSTVELLTMFYNHQEQLRIGVVGSSLPDLRECNQASFDYATKKDYPDFFLIKQTFKEGINWALNYVTKNN